MATTSALLTAEEFERLGDADGPAELVLGQVVPMEIPGFRHGLVCSKVAFMLCEYLHHEQIGVGVGRTGVVTRRNPDSVRDPDVSYFSYARIPRGEIPVGYAPQPPEIVFEVKSPSDTWKDLLTKTAEYLQAGVVNVCVVDPENETVTIYYANKPDVKLEGDAVFTLPELLPNFAVPIARFFHAQ